MKDDEYMLDFRAYVILRPYICMQLLESNLTYEEIDSALFGLFLEERDECEQEILELRDLFKKLTLKIINKVKKDEK